MIWIVWGNNLDKCPKIELEADSFDEVLKIARAINPDYNAGQVKEKEQAKEEH